MRPRYLTRRSFAAPPAGDRPGDCSCGRNHPHGSPPRSRYWMLLAGGALMFAASLIAHFCGRGWGVALVYLLLMVAAGLLVAKWFASNDLGD